MSKQKSTNKRRDQAITLAIVGGFVTIATALISSLIAPIALELLKRTPIPAGTLGPLSTIPTSPAITNMAVEDWRQVMALDLDPTLPLLCQGLVMPPSIRPDQDINQAAKQVMEESRATSFDSWLVGAKPDTKGVSLLLTVTNVPNQVEWIKLENNLDISIDAQSNPPELVNVLTATGCGGGLYRIFSDISLESDYENYSTTSTSSEFDFFTLQPGESETFKLSLICQAPGIYRVILNLHYSLLTSGGRAKVEYDRSIICPTAFTIWAIDMTDDAFVSSTSYIWNGTSYEVRP